MGQWNHEPDEVWDLQQKLQRMDVRINHLESKLDELIRGFNGHVHFQCVNPNLTQIKPLEKD